MKLKKLISIVAYIIFIQQVININLFANIDLIEIDDVSADGVAVMDLDTGRLIYGKNEDEKMAMASTTKIMTSLITLEQPNLDSYFEVDPKAIKVEGTSMGLLEGDMVTLRGLAIGMLLPSGNDAAEVAAIKIAGNKQNFIKLMNEKAKSLGCYNTHFANTSGLDDSNHYSTPKDMAILAKYALRNKDFAEICSKEYETLEYGNPPYKRTLKNRNQLLGRYKYCIGVKTGFTDNAGKCLVSAAKKDGISIIVVTLHGSDICQSHIDIYEKIFDNLCKYSPLVNLPINSVKVVGGEIVGVPIEKKYNAKISILNGEQAKLKNVVKLKKFLYAPVKKGDVIGEIDYYLDNIKVATEPITTVMDVKTEKHQSFWNNLFCKLYIKKANSKKYYIKNKM